MSTPSITPAQIIAVIGSIVAELVNDAFISGHTAKLIVGLAGVVVPAAWMLADAIIRHGRAQAHAAIVNAAADPSRKVLVSDTATAKRRARS